MRLLKVYRGQNWPGAQQQAPGTGPGPWLAYIPKSSFTNSPVTTVRVWITLSTAPRLVKKSPLVRFRNPLTVMTVRSNRASASCLSDSRPSGLPQGDRQNGFPFRPSGAAAFSRIEPNMVDFQPSVADQQATTPYEQLGDHGEPVASSGTNVPREGYLSASGATNNFAG